MTRALKELPFPAASQMPDTEITDEVVRDLFQSAEIIRDPDMKFPSRWALRELAESVNEMRRQIALAPTVTADIQCAAQFTQGLDLLHDSLPAVLQAWQRLSEYLGVEKARRELEALEQLRLAVANTREALFRNRAPAATQMQEEGGDRACWHRWGWLLVAMFRRAMGSTNPKVQLELSNDGPIARFLEAVIPLITGETPRGVTAVRWLQRNPDEG